MPGWQRALWGVAAVTWVATALYVILSIGNLPARVPMNYDGANEPGWYANRGQFYLWFAVMWLGGTLLFVFVRRPPSIGAAGCAFVNVICLLIFHLTYQQATEGTFLALTPDQTMLLILPVGFAFVGFAIYLAVTNPRASA